MLFRRRRPEPFFNRMRVAIWPRRGWLRSFRYFGKRALRLTATPHAIAAGLAAGAFASFTPFMGFHFLIGFLFAFIIGGNILASAIGTAVGNPLTFPFIWASTFKVGTLIIGRDSNDLTPSMIAKGPQDYSWSGISTWFGDFLPILKPMLVGALPLGLSLGIFLYIVTFFAVRTYQNKRQEKLLMRRARAESNTVPGAVFNEMSGDK